MENNFESAKYKRTSNFWGIGLVDVGLFTLSVIGFWTVPSSALFWVPKVPVFFNFPTVPFLSNFFFLSFVWIGVVGAGVTANLVLSYKSSFLSSIALSYLAVDTGITGSEDSISLSLSSDYFLAATWLVSEIFYSIGGLF